MTKKINPINNTYTTIKLNDASHCRVGMAINIIPTRGKVKNFLIRILKFFKLYKERKVIITNITNNIITIDRDFRY